MWVQLHVSAMKSIILQSFSRLLQNQFLKNSFSRNKNRGFYGERLAKDALAAIAEEDRKQAISNFEISNFFEKNILKKKEIILVRFPNV